MSTPYGLIHTTVISNGQIAICHGILPDHGPGPIKSPLPGPKGGVELRYIENLGIIQSAVYNALGVGRENTMSKAELSRIAGYKDRRIREAVGALRYDKVILNLDNGDGCYIPDSIPWGRQETTVWLAKQDRRMRSMKYSIRGARRSVAHGRKRDMPGQINMFGTGGT